MSPKLSPNLLDLVFVALVTLVSMGVVHYIIHNSNISTSKTPAFTSSESQITSE